ncbi:MAG TPA: acyl carrier protein [Verrucomicrobiae bacterium]
MEIEDKIRHFIVTNLYYAEDCLITPDDSFLETGVVDSMGVMELVSFIQSEFGVEVAQSEIIVENFDSIRRLASFVRRKQMLQRPFTSPPETAKTSGAAPVANRCTADL